jgi:hypothetical protein
MGDAMLQADQGVASVECQAMQVGVAFINQGLANGTVNGIYETFPEESGREPCPSLKATPAANCFDSSYQAVSLRYLIEDYLNMPTGGIPSTPLPVVSPAQVNPTGSLSPSALLPHIIHGMNQESLAIKTGNALGSGYSWCYVAGTTPAPPSAFQAGEISECANARVFDSKYLPSPQPSDPEPWFAAADAGISIELYSYLNTSVWPSIANQVTGFYGTCSSGFASNGDCTADVAQPFYL